MGKKKSHKESTKKKTKNIVSPAHELTKEDAILTDKIVAVAKETLSPDVLEEKPVTSQKHTKSSTKNKSNNRNKKKKKEVYQAGDVLVNPNMIIIKRDAPKVVPAPPNPPISTEAHTDNCVVKIPDNTPKIKFSYISPVIGLAVGFGYAAATGWGDKKRMIKFSIIGAVIGIIMGLKIKCKPIPDSDTVKYLNLIQMLWLKLFPIKKGEIIEGSDETESYEDEIDVNQQEHIDGE